MYYVVSGIEVGGQACGEVSGSVRQRQAVVSYVVPCVYTTEKLFLACALYKQEARAAIAKLIMSLPAFKSQAKTRGAIW